jgi:hypothetical protein
VNALQSVLVEDDRPGRRKTSEFAM